MAKQKVIDFARIKTSCSSCSLHDLCLPRGLTQENLEQLDSLVDRTQPLHQGDYLFRAGDKFQQLYAVRSGSVKLCMTSESGEEQIIGFYFPGEIIGLDAIDQQFHSSSAVVMETSTFCALPFRKLIDLCIDLPDLNYQMMRLMSHELSEGNELLLTLCKKNADEKIATFLVSISGRLKRLGYSSSEFRLNMSRQEIGNYLGLTLETVSRILNKFQRSNIILIDHKLVKIKQAEKLAQLSSCSRGSAGEQTA